MNSRSKKLIAIAVAVPVIAAGVWVMGLGYGGLDSDNGNGQPFTVSDDVRTPTTTWDVIETDGGVRIIHDTGDRVYGEDGLYFVHGGERHHISQTLSTGQSIEVREGDLGTTFENGDTVYLIWDEGDGAAVFVEYELSDQ